MMTIANDYKKLWICSEQKLKKKNQWRRVTKFCYILVEENFNCLICINKRITSDKWINVDEVDNNWQKMVIVTKVRFLLYFFFSTFSSLKIQTFTHKVSVPLSTVSAIHWMLILQNWFALQLAYFVIKKKNWKTFF